MPIYKDDNGTYTVRFYSEDPVRGVRKQIKKRGFKTKREAVQWEMPNRCCTPFIYAVLAQ